MTILLAIVLVAALGTWIPLAQLLPGTPGRTRVFYVAVGNAVFAGIALLTSGAGLVLGWRGFWLPLAGGVVWTAGNYCVFKASETIGLARAAGTWTPLNIIVAFAWGALLFGELDGFSKARFAVLGAAFLAVVAGIGNLALLALVARVGTGTGFTIAQLSLLVNASVGVWVFHVPEPGTRQARKVLAGIVLAGIGGCVIAAMR